MKILHVITTLNSGGAEKMLLDIVKEMQKQAIHCEVAVLTASENFFGEDFAKLHIPIYYGPTHKVYSINNILFLKRLIQKNKYDCIHTHLFASQLFMPIAMKLARKDYPLITTEHSTHNKRRDSKKFYCLDSWLYHQYEKIIAITVDTKENLRSYLPSVGSKIEVIENGIDINQYAEALPIERAQLCERLGEDEKIVLMVAAMREQKDHETLIRASKLLPKEYKIIFVGEGERREEVQNYAREHGRASILFLGRRADVPSIMKASDVFVLSSKWEGFGLVVVEAAATGLPVVASDVEGLNSVVNTIGGQVFEPYNERMLAEKIVASLESEKVELDVSEYTIQKTVSKYLDLYKEILKE